MEVNQESTGCLGDRNHGIHTSLKEAATQPSRGAEAFDEMRVQDNTRAFARTPQAKTRPSDANDRDHEVTPRMDMNNVDSVAYDQTRQIERGPQITTVADGKRVRRDVIAATELFQKRTGAAGISHRSPSFLQVFRQPDGVPLDAALSR